MKNLKKLKIYNIYRKIISTIYPNICPFCGRIIDAADYWCKRCEEYLPYVKKPLFPPENVSRFYSCCYYTQRARKAVHSLKFVGVIYAADAFAQMMSKMLSDELENADFLVPVPSGFRSIEKRGFAPAEIIAKRISWQSKAPVVKAIKTKDNKLEQKALGRKKRIENAKNSFYINEKVDLRGKRIILIDDVCTTGSTLSVAAELLLDAGAKEVVAAVFAKTVNYTHAKLSQRKFSVKKRG